MKVLVACEYSGIVRDAFLERGHDAWSCDLLPTERNSNRHIQGDARVHRMPPGKDRWRERSRFFPGIAQAMAEQWG